MGDSLKTAAQVSFGGLLVAAGAFAPLAGPFAGVLAVGAAVGQAVAARGLEARGRRRLSAPAALLRNHDLQLLVSHALERSLRSAVDDGFLKGRAKEIKKLAEQVPGYFEAFRAAPPESFADAALPDLVRDFAAPGPAVEAGVWEEVVEDLAIRAGCSRDIIGVKKELAEHLGAHFERFVVEIFKEDATGKGPAGGKGWAALELLFWGLLRADLEALGEGLEASQELARRHVEELRKVDAKLDELVRWHGSGVTNAEPALAELLQSLGGALSRQIDEIKALFADGLRTPSEFEAAYWRERRVDDHARALWEQPRLAKILRESFVGREAELEAFGRFLDAETPWVLHLHGKPGNGKSRLMLAYARKAHEAGRRVFFVERDPGNLRQAVRSLGPGAPIVLLWDDYRGRPEGAMDSFLGLDGASGPVIKRVVATWPTVQVFPDRSQGSRRADRALEPVSDDAAMRGLARALLPSLSEGEAAHIVQLAEGYPDALLAAVQLVETGKHRPWTLPKNLLHAVDDALIERAQKVPGLTAEQATRALLALALTERVDLGVEAQREAFAQAGVDKRTLAVLADAHVAARLDGAQEYELKPDRFRVHVVARALDASSRICSISRPRSWPGWRRRYWRGGWMRSGVFACWLRRVRRRAHIGHRCNGRCWAASVMLVADWQPIARGLSRAGLPMPPRRNPLRR